MMIKWGTGDGMYDPVNGPGDDDGVDEPTSEVPDETPRPADSLRSAWRRIREAFGPRGEDDGD